MVCMRKCCCCCCRVRTGTTVLGTVGVILSVILLIPACLSAARVEWVASRIRGPVQVANVAEELIADSSVIKDTYDDIYMTVMGVSYGVIAWLVLHLFSCILLIKGASDGKPYLLIPWLVIMIFNILPVTGSFIVLIVFASASKEVFFVPATVVGIILGFEIYYWIVVLSTFQELRNEIRFGNPIPPITVVNLPSLNQGSLPAYERMTATPEAADTVNAIV